LRNKGLWYGVAAYSIWGLFPIYWKLFPDVPAIEVLGHRIVWSFVALAALILARRSRDRRLLGAVSAHVIALYSSAAVLIGFHWFLYVWAVNHGFIVETSLGYFITPLVNVLLGVLVFRERLRTLQWVAVGLAAAGVLHLTRAYGTLPWIAVGLALSFGSYGLVKKKSPLGSLEGLTLETAILLVPAVVYLLAADRGGEGAFFRVSAAYDAWLIGGGVITIVPLLLFASAVRRVPLSIVGILQYISPTIQFLLGVLVYKEPFAAAQVTGFAIVWTALIVFGADGLSARRQPVIV
jgi:chloramphenicol-sensitive protein RarD